MDLYNILELSKDATTNDIKKNFKQLALKYHPDKNINKKSNINFNEKFNQIRIAYDILSNPEKKLKYDNMSQSKKNNLIDTLFQFLKKITNPEIINNILLRPDIIKDIKQGDINVLSNNLIKTILDNIELDINIDKLSEVFIHNVSTPTPTPTPTSTSIPTKSTKPNQQSESDILSTSDYSTLNIFKTIKIKLEDVYNNRLQEIIIKRKIYKNSQIIDNEVLKYNIPLYDNKIIIDNAGDKIINDDNKIIDIGKTIIKLVYVSNNDNLIKDNYNIILKNYITMHELFYGLIRKIKYFNLNIDLSSDNPLKEYIFNGEYLEIIIEKKGIKNSKNKFGDLIIKFYLIKNDEFEHKLKTLF